MTLDLPQDNGADSSVRNPHEYQSPHFYDLSHEETTVVLLQLLDAMGLQVRRVDGRLILDKKE